MKKLIRVGWLFFIIVVIILTLFRCSPYVVHNHKEATIAVHHNNKVVKNNDLLLGREQEIHFSFITGISRGLTPKVYVYGPVKVEYYPKTDASNIIRADVGQKMKTRFTRPGEAIIMFIWESESAFSDSITIYLKYDDN